MDDDYKLVTEEFQQILYNTYLGWFSDWISALENIVGSLQTIADYQDFTGNDADAFKSYINDVYLSGECSLPAMLMELLAEIDSGMLTYLDSLGEVDQATTDDDSPIFSYEAAEEYRDFVKNHTQTLTSISEEVDGILSGINGIDTPGGPVNISSVDLTSYYDKADAMDSFIETMHEDVIANEEKELEKIAGYRELYEGIKSLVELYRGTKASEYDPTNSSFYDTKEFLEAKDIFVRGATNRMMSMTEYERALASYNARMEYYEELALQRRQTEAIQRATIGVIALGAGAASIIFTAGAATPAVATIVAGGFFGTGSLAYGYSNLMQAAGEGYCYSQGDIQSAAINPWNDYLFQGNEVVGDTVGRMFVSGSATMATFGYFSEAGLAESAVKDQLFTTIAEFAIGEPGNLAVENYCKEHNINPVYTMLLEIAFGMALSFAYGGIHYALNGGRRIGKVASEVTDSVAGQVDNLPGQLDEMVEGVAPIGYNTPELEYAEDILDSVDNMSARQLDDLYDNDFYEELFARQYESCPEYEDFLADIREHISDADIADDYNFQCILSYEGAEEIAFDAIHGPNNASEVVLGKYGDGGPTAYTSIAKDMNAQYFQLDNWDELVEKYSDDEIWKINEKFLDIQTSSGREIYLSHNPEDFIGKNQFYSKELQYLMDNGYRFVVEGGIWHAIR